MAISVILDKMDAAVRASGQAHLFHLWLDNRPVLTSLAHLQTYAMFFVVAAVSEALGAAGVHLPEGMTVTMESMQNPNKALPDLERAVRKNTRIFRFSGFFEI